MCNASTGVISTARTCNGTGTCQATTTTACAPYSCTGTACRTSCQNNTDCASSATCIFGSCVAATGALLLGRVTEVTGIDTTYNLTAEGNADWVQWGGVTAGDADDVQRNRKASPVGGMQRIQVEILNGGGYGRYEDRAPKWSWTDGSPVASAPAAIYAVYVSDTNNGFRVTINASASVVRTVRLYVGQWNTTARMRARLSDNSAAEYTDMQTATAPGRDFIYEFAVRGGTTNITAILEWTVQSASVVGGNVTFGGCAVSQ